MAVDKILLSYLAGIMDGEGHIGIYIRQPCRGGVSSTFIPQISVSMTDKEIVELFVKRYGGHYSNRKRNKHWKRSYEWVITCNKVMQVIKELKPYMRIKRKIKVANCCIEINKRMNRKKLAYSRITKKEFNERMKIVRKSREC